MDDMGGDRYIQSVFRALKMMEYIAECRQEAGLTEIGRGVGLSKSTTHGLISTLERCGYIRQNPATGKYSLGLKLFELGQAYAAGLDLREVALPYLRELSARYQETVHLAVLSEGDVVYIDKVDGPLSIGIRSRVGGRNPAHCTGVGKVLISAVDPKKLELLYAGKTMKRFTEHTVTDWDTLRSELQKVREVGYAWDREEFENELWCVAAPVRDGSDTVAAAISLSGPAQRMKSTDREQVAADVLNTAQKISRQLGYRDG
ncbi:MAG TPA: IclR family transcriptional regulator [Patescibacteria group bacterium]|nr:IclR family transcriptional regulator [Patescibacteria group bacterium]